MAHNTGQKQTILVADDDEFAREWTCEVIRSLGVNVISAQDGGEAIDLLEEVDGVAIVDLNMPRATGLEVLRIATRRRPDLPVILLSGAGEIEDAVVALKHGAWDYITKPCDQDELLARVREALRVSRLESENAVLRSQTVADEPVDIICRSDAGHEMLERARRCASVDSTVLLTGPSGTGKSLLARYIHQHGVRGSGPFVTVNCGALPRELIESELFGHEKGAFTGATQMRAGRFESAQGGTLFLDEIAELPLELQPKLLTAIQERRYSRVGSSSENLADVRVIAATNRDLVEEVKEKRFREDLYFRLNVLRIEIPSLCARAEDIVPLAEYTLKRVAARLGLPTPSLTDAACQALASHNWPGNVRELENVLERAMVFCQSASIDAGDLGEFSDLGRGPSDADLVGIPIEELERRAILATLESFGGNRAEAARALGVSERTVYNRLRTYGRDVPEDAAADVT